MEPLLLQILCVGVYIVHKHVHLLLFIHIMWFHTSCHYIWRNLSASKQACRPLCKLVYSKKAYVLCRMRVQVVTRDGERFLSKNMGIFFCLFKSLAIISFLPF